MSYREENEQVILTMNRDDYERLLLALGAGTAGLARGGANVDSILAFVNRLNEGNPRYHPYKVTEQTDSQTSPSSKPR